MQIEPSLLTLHFTTFWLLKHLLAHALEKATAIMVLFVKQLTVWDTIGNIRDYVKTGKMATDAEDANWLSGTFLQKPQISNHFHFHEL